MKTPICDFINGYAQKDCIRLHMPGHKGKSQLGFEKFDITEIFGADSLYNADGIIRESEENASLLFGSGKTLYSTEGSSHCIRAMVYLAKMYGGTDSNYILAGRNAHSSFISACALNGMDVEWIFPKDGQSYLSCVITPEILEKALGRVDKKPACVYVTSPDYLGNMCDISALSEVCKRYGIPLVVDNAHGAYLKFLKDDLHPISKGACLCCDSAHKTLPVLTGGAYLHVSKDAPKEFFEGARDALSLFGSTSPSYLTLASLDNANKYISQVFPKKLDEFLERTSSLVSSLSCPAVIPCSPLREPMKIVLETKKIGHRGRDFAKILEANGIVCEFCDDDYVVLMPSPENGDEEICNLVKILSEFEWGEPILESSFELVPPRKKMTVREAVYAPRERVSVDKALGRVLAASSVFCPPAISLIVCGEEFNQSTVELCKKYGFDSFWVVKE